MNASKGSLNQQMNTFVDRHDLDSTGAARNHNARVSTGQVERRDGTESEFEFIDFELSEQNFGNCFDDASICVNSFQQDYSFVKAGAVDVGVKNSEQALFHCQFVFVQG